MTWTLAQSLPPVPEGLSIAPWAGTFIMAIGWIITALAYLKDHKKLTAEIGQIKADRDKLMAEAIQAAGTTLERKQASSTAYRDACMEVRAAASDLIKVVTESKTSSSKRRNALCAIIADKVLHSFHHYCEWTKLELRNRPDEMEHFVLQVVCPELDVIAGWVRICNHDRFVKDDGLARFEITGPTVHVYAQLCSDLEKQKRETVMTFVVRGIDAIVKA